MNYIDFAIAASLFIFFFAAVIVFTASYFSSFPGLAKTSELETVAEGLFNILFNRKGVPEDWNLNYSISPVKVGLMEHLYIIPILVQEDMGSGRTNEPVTLYVIFDENCENKTWNTTVRLYDEDKKELNIELSNVTFCVSQFLSRASVTWEVNISANQTKTYYLYYSPEESISDPAYPPITYNTSSWIPNDGDAWTETTANWLRYEGSSGSVTNDTVNKVVGEKSVNITGTFSASALGLRYDPPDNITGVSNGWYLDAWLYVDNKTNLTTINVRVNDNNESIYVNISDSIESGVWYHFEKELSQTEWSNWTSFNASNGIDYVDFYVENSSAGLTRTLKIDGLHFKKKPLRMKKFPEERKSAISYSKFETLKNLGYEKLRKTVGEYKLSIRIDNETYGGRVSQSANAVCYRSPMLIQYKNGTVRSIVPKLCVWK